MKVKAMKKKFCNIILNALKVASQSSITYIKANTFSDFHLLNHLLFIFAISFFLKLLHDFSNLNNI